MIEGDDDDDDDDADSESDSDPSGGFCECTLGCHISVCLSVSLSVCQSVRVGPGPSEWVVPASNDYLLFTSLSRPPAFVSYPKAFTSSQSGLRRKSLRIRLSGFLTLALALV